MTTVASSVVRIGTRGSQLALVQARLVADALTTVGVETRTDTIVTDGDRREPDTAWGEGAFVGAIESALLDGRIDVAVHSAKDVPTDEDPRLAIAAYVVREPAEDVIVLAASGPAHPAGGDRADHPLDVLPKGARVGTDSPRRTAFLRAARPDLEMHPLHGNVDTRLRRLEAGETDALVLAAAGLRRLGREDRISVVVPTSIIPPAPGQGALAVQVRSDDAATRAVVARLDDPDVRRAVEAERSLLAASGGGCRSPLGAIASVTGHRLTLSAGYARPDGLVTAFASRLADEGPDADAGRDADLVAAVLEDLAAGAAAGARTLGLPRVVVTRPSADAAATLLALVDRGLAPVSVPTIEIAAPEDRAAIDAMDDAVRRIAGFDWIVMASANAVAALAAAAGRLEVDLTVGSPRWAAVGGATRRALRSVGVSRVFTPQRADGRGLADTLPDVGGARVLLPRSDLADDTLPGRLAERGAIVEAVVAYRTIEAPATSAHGLEVALAGGISAIVVTSASAVRGWLALARAVDAEAATRSIPLVAIGPSAAREARDLGLPVIAVASAPDPGSIADATVTALSTLEVHR